jgi:hypothetical protein
MKNNMFAQRNLRIGLAATYGAFGVIGSALSTAALLKLPLTSTALNLSIKDTRITATVGLALSCLMLGLAITLAVMAYYDDKAVKDERSLNCNMLAARSSRSAASPFDRIAQGSSASDAGTNSVVPVTLTEFACCHAAMGR